MEVDSHKTAEVQPEKMTSILQILSSLINFKLQFEISVFGSTLES